MNKMNKNKPNLKQAFTKQLTPNADYNSFQQNISPAFELIGTDQDKQKFCAIINTIAESETGRKTLEIAAKAGYKLKMEFAFGSNGGTSKSKKLIVLSPLEKLEVLMGVLVHEARHAGQFERGELDSENTARPRNYDLKSELMKYRATEADAQAAAAQALWELVEKGNMDPFRALARVSPEITDPFTKAGYQEPEAYQNGRARTAAFLGWYDNAAIKTAYEQAYTVDVITLHIDQGLEKQDHYNQKADAHEIIAQTCVDEKGKCYFTDKPEIIAQGKFVDLNPKTKAFLTDYFKDYSQRTGQKPDQSLISLPVRENIPFVNNFLHKSTSAKMNIVDLIVKNNNIQK